MMYNIQSLSNAKRLARTGGILYLVIIVAGFFGEAMVRNKLTVPGNAALTTLNIFNNQLLWRAGIAGDLIMHVCDVGLMLVFYLLLKPVNKNLALLSVLFTLIQTAVLAANKLNLFTPLFLVENNNYLKAFNPQQLQALTYTSIKMHEHGFAVGLIFFSFTCFTLGYLIFKSGYFPKILGVLMQIAGACYLVNSFALILFPGFQNNLFPYILLPPFIAELSLCLWLLIKGVKSNFPSGVE